MPARTLTAPQWDRWYLTGTPQKITQLECEAFYRYATPGLGRTVVDIGCGVGAWTRQLARWGLTVTGYDYSSEAIKRAMRSAGHKESYRFWDVDADPVAPDRAPGSVDIITCRLSLPYFDWPRLRDTVVPWLPGRGCFHALIPVTGPSGTRDPYRRGMTDDQINRLADGWASATFYRTHQARGVVLRGYGG
ncbi:class I SAM-dependent methyltransferase [Streptomyces noboritoensis]|uniref:Class I SAM-dependent methyltransferase n=1 Tax=Streptomyces noboritoensis TaxID=67337 RepID=A0ABV6TFV0_9ACTN